MSKKYVYLFSEGNANMRELLGGKGANLAEMTNIGLPVPQGFTITTEACTQYYEDGQKINDGIQAEIMEYITKLEGITGKKFGDLENPLLVSVRSGARASMPGMMDTILNLGLNEDVVDVLAKKSGNPRWAWDCYRRFIQMYSDVVMEVGKKYFEQLIDQMKEARGVTQDVELTADERIAAKTGFAPGTELYYIQRVHYLDGMPLILNHNYFLKSAVPGLSAEIAAASIYEYLENTLHVTIVNSRRVMTVEKITEIDEKYLELDVNDYNCLAVISSHTYNSDGVMFEYTFSRHRPDYFKFQDNAVRRGAGNPG